MRNHNKYNIISSVVLLAIIINCHLETFAQIQQDRVSGLYVVAYPKSEIDSMFTSRVSVKTGMPSLISIDIESKKFFIPLYDVECIKIVLDELLECTYTEVDCGRNIVFPHSSDIYALSKCNIETKHITLNMDILKEGVKLSPYYESKDHSMLLKIVWIVSTVKRLDNNLNKYAEMIYSTYMPTFDGDLYIATEIHEYTPYLNMDINRYWAPFKEFHNSVN